MIVYKAFNKNNNKVYIGITSQSLYNRKLQHKHDTKRFDTYFMRAINKHGFESFEWSILESCNSRKEISDRERYYVKLYNSNNKYLGYNSTSGGEKLYKATPEVRDKMSKAQKGRKHSKEAIEKIRQANLGKKVSEEVKITMSKSQSGRKHSEATKLKISKNRKGGTPVGFKWNKKSKLKLSNVLSGKRRKPLSEEHKRKISISQKGRTAPNKGKKLSEAIKLKISNSMRGKNNPFYGKKHTKETKDKISRSKRKGA